MDKQNIEIVWFKRDLRVHDHQPLVQASKYNQVLPIYVFEIELWRQTDHSYRHYLFLKEALKDLEKQLKALGANLAVFVGRAVDIFEKLYSQYQINNIFSHQETWNLWTYNRDKAVKSWARDKNVEWVETPKNGVIRNLSDRNRWSQRWYATMSSPLISAPHKIKSVKVRSDNIPDASLLNLSTEQSCTSQKATRSAAIDTLNSLL